MLHANIIKKAVDIVFPPRCFSCHVLVAEHGALCGDCWSSVQFINTPLCYACGFPFDYDLGEGALCASCIAKRPSYHQGRSVMYYDASSSHLITRFKYADKTHVAQSLARLMAKAGQELLEKSDFILPVPMHKFRLFKRRYNQAALLANALGQLSDIKVLHHALIRYKNTPPQASLTSKQRYSNVKGAFTFDKHFRNVIEGKNLLLVDDVTTTGATLEACSNVLLQSGAEQVNVLTVAKTVIK